MKKLITLSFFLIISFGAMAQDDYSTQPYVEWKITTKVFCEGLPIAEMPFDCKFPNGVVQRFDGIEYRCIRIRKDYDTKNKTIVKWVTVVEAKKQHYKKC